MNRDQPPTELPVIAGTFGMMFTSTRRGARLARLLAVQRLDTWGVRYDSAGSRTVALLIAELAANAVQHGQVPGRDFQLGLALQPTAAPGSAAVRIEVSDARAERWPTPRAPGSGTSDGLGLLLIEAFAAKWGVAERDIGKTVWCECVLEPGDL